MKFQTRCCVVLLVAAAALRLAGINFQLWLDEIWSIRLAQTATSPLGVFFLHHDNNHWLNTLYLYFLGPGRPWWEYHLLPEITGIGTVVIGWLLARRSWVVLLLLGGSEFLIEFSTDARGYAPAGFFALLCLWLLEQHLDRPRRTTGALLAVSAMLGILSHLTFAVVLVGLMLSALIGVRRKRGSIPAAVFRTVEWFGLPVALLATLYFVDVRVMVRGGGPPTPTDLPAQAAAMVMGIPVGSFLAAPVGILVMVLCAMQVWRIYRAGDVAWPLGVVLMLFVPAVLFFWPRTDYLHPRYIYVAVPFLLILLGLELERWLDGPWWAAAAVCTALAAFIAVNAMQMWALESNGRGDYMAAMRFLRSQTVGPDVVVATDTLHPMSTLMVLQYYWYSSTGGPRLAAMHDTGAPGQWPQWLVLEEDLGQFVTAADGVRFDRRTTFPRGAVTSGVSWTVYEAESARPNVSPENLEPLSR
jgi:hypothetical protein